MNLQQKLEQMATTAFERRLLKRWLETSDKPSTADTSPTRAANSDQIEADPPAATGTDGV